MIDSDGIQERHASLSAHLDERARRLAAATEATAAGYGGMAAGARATGIAERTIGRGKKDLAGAPPLEPGRVRRAGGGRKSLVEKNPGLQKDLLALVEPDSRGDPMSPLRWTSKSLRHLADELIARGHSISHTVVGELLKAHKFSLQGNRKTKEGEEHPDRNTQFLHINRSVAKALANRQPVISVDTKKKSWWATSRTTGGSGGRRVTLKTFVSMTF